MEESIDFFFLSGSTLEDRSHIGRKITAAVPMRRVGQIEEK